MNVRKYIVLIVFFLFYFQNHTLSNEEKTNLENFFSEKSIEYIQKEIQVFKKAVANDMKRLVEHVNAKQWAYCDHGQTMAK